MKHSLYAVLGIVAIAAVSFLSYDLLKREASPCDTIFEQASVQMGTKLTVLDGAGEISIGAEQVQALTEAAQQTALNLKTCCVALDQGRLGADQFLDCKTSARRYEDRLDLVLARLEAAEAVRSERNSDASDSELRAAEAAVDEAVAEAKAVAANLDAVVDAAVEAIPARGGAAAAESVPPRGRTPSPEIGSEIEPNDDLFTATPLPMDSVVAAEIQAGDDSDFFSFTTPPKFRDYVELHLENRSMSLRPHIRLLDGNKSQTKKFYDHTAGADLRYRFASDPDAKFYLHIQAVDGDNAGAYRLSAESSRAYDAFEPNDDIVHSAQVEFGKAIDAAIMDGGDRDFYVFTVPESGELSVKLTNRSATLRPHLVFFDGQKSQLQKHYDHTPGADLHYAMEAQAGEKYFVVVEAVDHDNSGEYQLLVSGP